MNSQVNLISNGSLILFTQLSFKNSKFTNSRIDMPVGQYANDYLKN
jgi:hypothetical protein